MKTITINKGFHLLVALLIPNSITLALELNIPNKRSEKSEWCWNACSEMVLRYYAIYPSQTAIASWVFGVSTVTDYHNQQLALVNTNSASRLGVNTLLDHFDTENRLGNFIPNVPSGTTLGSLSKNDMFLEINKWRPIIIGSRKTATYSGHLIVITGYVDNSATNPDIIVQDPNPTGGGRYVKSLAFIQKTTGWEWTHSLRMEKSGWGGVGVLDGVFIATSDFNYSDPANARQFTANFYRADGSTDLANNWVWTLMFSHTNGKYSVASFNDPAGFTSSSVWNAPGFTLPGNYTWLYDQNGAITGELAVSCVDLEGYFHSNIQTVTYARSIPYPMIQYYAYSTLSGYLPEIKAHKTVTLENILIEPGADIAFKAGECIMLYANVSVQNGGEIKFSVDPALK